MQRRLRMGMVGGGLGSFIGEVHRMAAALDGEIELVAGAFSRNQDVNVQTGEKLHLDQSRIYSSYQEMANREKSLPAEKRIDFVSITTPNHVHFPIAKVFLEAGFHVMCEKPMTISLDEAAELESLVVKTGKRFGLMHNYTGYPMVKLARDMVRQGDLGKIRKVVVCYPQGWLAQPIDAEGQKQASWRTDPAQSGLAGCLGDIGSHCENLAEYITGLKITEVCADLTSFVSGRKLDDDGNCLLKFDNGAKGVLHCSQISIGEENALSINVYGDKGGLEWHQEKPNHLLYKPLDKPVESWQRGNGYVGQKSPAAGRCTRLPYGHNEAFIEAFANIYKEFSRSILDNVDSKNNSSSSHDFPQASDGVRGMAFIEAAVANSRSDKKWTSVDV